MIRLRLVLPLLVLGASLPGGDAAAQFARSAPPRPTAQPTRPPPPALPGLEGRQAPLPIPAEPGQNLAPNPALFDAINRGDLPAAREAISRGADVESRNVLGLTPVDAAVDQGQREILFYLLSVRGAPRGGAAPDPAPPPAQAPPRRAGRTLPEARVPAEPLPVAAPGGPRAQLWAGDGGAPVPELGFLGFDAGRPAGAVAPADVGRPARGTRPVRGRG